MFCESLSLLQYLGFTISPLLLLRRNYNYHDQRNFCCELDFLIRLQVDFKYLLVELLLDFLPQMLLSRKHSNPEQDDDPPGAWSSSAFPSGHEKPFDRHSFGRMDLPAFSIQENESVGAEHLSTSSRRLASFAFNDEGFGIEHTISHPQNGPAYDEEPPDKNDFEDQPKREHSYRTILPGEITPYLGLRARLTQIPINRWTILILLVLARMCILFDGLNTNFTSAQQEATSACSKVEDIGSTLASMPHYLSLGGEFQ